MWTLLIRILIRFKVTRFSACKRCFVNPDGSLGKQISEILYFEPYTLLTSDIITQLFSEESTGLIVSDAFMLKLANRLCLYNNVLVKILKLQPRLVSATLRRDTYALD